MQTREVFGNDVVPTLGSPVPGGLTATPRCQLDLVPAVLLSFHPFWAMRALSAGLAGSTTHRAGMVLPYPDQRDRGYSSAKLTKPCRGPVPSRSAPVISGSVACQG